MRHPPSRLSTSDAGLALLEHHEGFRARPYRCPAGVLTIGYGTTAAAGFEIRKGMSVTRERAREMLRQSLARQYEPAVRQAVTVELSQAEFDALVSFTYNLGAGALRTSKLLRLLNAGDRRGAAREFDRWVYAGKKKWSGLVRRRADERALFESGTPVSVLGPAETVTGADVQRLLAITGRRAPDETLAPLPRPDDPDAA